MSHDFESRERKELHQTLIEETVTELVNQNSFIDSCKQVKDIVNEQNEIQVSEEEARKCMRDIGMRYKKVKHIAMTANSDRSLVLRQKWALEFLKQNHASKVWLNIDETWLGMSDFRRIKW